MKEYFVVANSFAAPFFSDTSEEFVKGDTPREALNKFVSNYKHPCGLFAAALYGDANDYHKGIDPLLRWLCNHEIEKQRITKDMGSYAYNGHDAGKFEINGKLYVVDNPKGGKIL